MIDFWIFPLSTIWGAYHFKGLRDFYDFYNYTLHHLFFLW